MSPDDPVDVRRLVTQLVSGFDEELAARATHSLLGEFYRGMMMVKRVVQAFDTLASRSVAFIREAEAQGR